MNVKDFLEKTYEEGNEFQVRPRVVCKDGFNISIQGGTCSHYCDPREDVNIYNDVELGFPSELDLTICNYAEEEGTNQTVFAYVPIQIVETLIKKHGGILGTLGGIK